jgi:hypothetical protein
LHAFAAQPIAGTGIALLAGLHTVDEARAALQTMQANVAKAGGQISVGLTVFPSYADGLFKNGCCSHSFSYQNAGDWPWFGARIVQGLAQLGLVDEAKAALRPMIDTVCQYQDFNECAPLLGVALWRCFPIVAARRRWYNQHNIPSGSAKFHGAAGAIGKALRMLYGNFSL